MLKKTETIYLRGDVRTDMVGNRYDNRLHSMREQSVPCQVALTEFLDLLKTYCCLSGTDLRETQPGQWMEDPNYLTAYAVDAKALYDRFDDLSCWFNRLSQARRAQEAQRLEQERLRRQALRELLLSVPAAE